MIVVTLNVRSNFQKCASLGAKNFCPNLLTLYTTYMYIYIYIYIYIYAHTYVSIYMYMYMYMYTTANAHMDVCSLTFLEWPEGACMYVCMHGTEVSMHAYMLRPRMVKVILDEQRPWMDAVVLDACSDLG